METEKEIDFFYCDLIPLNQENNRAKKFKHKETSSVNRMSIFLKQVTST